MAAQPARKLEDMSQDFNAEQLGSIGALAEVHGYNPAEVMKNAVTIGLVTQETVDKIEKTMGGRHIGLFQRAFAKERQQAGRGEAAAFIRAFEGVYGKFMLEQGPRLKRDSDGAVIKVEGVDQIDDDDLEHPGSDVMKMLERVLKFKVDKKLGLEGRSELRAMIGRLREVEASRKVRGDRVKKIAELDSERAQPGLKKVEMENRAKKLGDVGELIGKIGNSDELNGNFAGLQRVQGEIRAINDRIDELKQEKKTFPAALEAETEKISTYIENVKKLAGALGEYRDATSTQNNGNDMLDSVIEKLSAVTIGSKEDFEKWEKYLNDVVMQFLQELKPLKLNRKSTDEDRALNEKISAVLDCRGVVASDMDGLRAAVYKLDQIQCRGRDNPGEISGKERDRVEKVRSEKEFFDATWDSLKSIFDGESFGDLTTRENFELLPELEDVCKAFTEKRLEFDKNHVKDGNAKDGPAHMEEMIQDYRDFVAKVGELLAGVKGDNDGKLSEVRQFLDEVDARVDALGSFKGPAKSLEEILAAAFPDAKSGAEIIGLEEDHKRAEKDEHHLGDVSKYFSDAENIKRITDGCNELKTLVEGMDFDKVSFKKRISHLTQQVKSNAGRRDALVKSKDRDALFKSKDKNGKVFELSIMEEADRLSDAISVAEEELAQLNEIMAKAKEWRGELVKLISNLVAADHAGIKMDFAYTVNSKNDKNEDIKEVKTASLKDLVKELKGINPGNAKFDPNSLIKFYDKFGGLFEDPQKVEELMKRFYGKMAEKKEATGKAKKSLEKAKAESSLTDATAAKRVIGVLTRESFPNISEVDQGKLTTLRLASDVGTIQSKDDAETLARNASAELMDTVNQVGIRGKLLSLKYEETDSNKVISPFQGLKPEQFSNWAEIEKLFKLGRLNQKNGFLLLAALERFDLEKDPSGKTRSVQAINVAKKVKELLAKDFEVEDFMDHSSISATVDKAFNAQLEAVRETVKSHFSNYEQHGAVANDYMTKSLNDEYAELCDDLADGKITQEAYGLEVAKLVKQAVEADVTESVDFMKDKVAVEYWNSKEAQWLRDRAYDIAMLTGKTAFDLGVTAPAKLIGRGLWGATKLGTSLGVNALLLPVRAAKYPLILAGHVAAAPINLFRKQKLGIPSMRAKFKDDVKRVSAYSKEAVTSSWKGAKANIAHDVKAGWNSTKYKRTDHAERNKKHREKRAANIKAFKEKAKMPVVKIASSPFIDMTPYKEQIAKSAALLGIDIKAPHGHDVSVGPSASASAAATAANHEDHTPPAAETHGHADSHGHH